MLDNTQQWKLLHLNVILENVEPWKSVMNIWERRLGISQQVVYMSFEKIEK